MRSVVVGTAGHVDHGKSSLVRALTGTDPDRLAEEKSRGLTIELGFATRALPDGTLASFVDVPGHEDFIRNMLAGAGGIDAVLLVIAADEGPMPQTREHLAILDLLGIGIGVVALSKADLVEPEWLELVREEAAELVAGSHLEGAPVLPVSATSGEGLDELLEALASTLRRVPASADRGRARLSADRVFSLSGFGTVVTGTLRDGRLRTGAALEILPKGLSARTRGLQTHGEERDEALPGTRVAVNLAGVDRDEVRRGDVVAPAGAWRPTRLVDVGLRMLPDALTELEQDREIMLFHGASEILARARVIGAERIAPGERGFAQLRLERPSVLAAGDRFVLRLPSPSVTIGGGRVLDPRPSGRRRRFDETVIARFRTLAAGSAEDRALAMLAAREPCRPDALAPADTGLEVAERDAALGALRAEGRARDLDGQGLWMTETGWVELAARMRARLADYHARFPLRAGPPPEELRERLELSPEAFGAALAEAEDEGWLARAGGAPRLADHRVELSSEQQARADDLLARFRAAPFTPPSAKEAEAELGPELLEALLARGDLVAAANDVLFDRPAYEELVEAVRAQLAAEGRVTVADIRDRFDTSRKYALGLLEHLERQRITRREGDAHVAPGTPIGAAEAGGEG